MKKDAWERAAWFTGEVARPFCLISTGIATAWTIFDGKDATVISAAGLVLMALYGAKAAEVAFVSRNRRADDPPAPPVP